MYRKDRDFYLPKVSWPEAGCLVNYGGQEEEEFLNGYDDFIMTQVIYLSTFGASGMGGNVLDLILTSDLKEFWKLNIVLP